MLDALRELTPLDLLNALPAAVLGILGGILSIKQEKRKWWWLTAFAVLTVVGVFFNLYQVGDGRRDARIQRETLQTKLDNLTGGDTYALVLPGVVTLGDGTQRVGFYLSEAGQHPLYSLTVHVGRLYRVAQNDNTIQTVGVMRKFGEINTSTTYPLLFAEFPADEVAYYSAYMSARNGSWEEVIELRRINSMVTWRTVLFGSEGYGTTPNKLLADLADEQFPEAFRHATIYPPHALPLPHINPTQQDKK